MGFEALRVTGEQIRAARALARIEQSDLAESSALSLQTIKRLEGVRGAVDMNLRTLNAIVNVFEGLGVRLEPSDAGGGVSRILSSAPYPRPKLVRTEKTRGANPVQDVYRLIFYSRFLADDDVNRQAEFDQIATVAASDHTAHDVTGVGIADNGYVLQAMEGPKDRIQQIYSSICLDRRHVDLTVLDSRIVSARQFNDWTACAACAEPDHPALSKEPALVGGLNPALLSPSGALGLLSILRELQVRASKSRRPDDAAVLSA